MEAMNLRESKGRNSAWKGWRKERKKKNYVIIF